MSNPIILTEALTKKYGGEIAVDRLDLTIEEGEVFGVLGPNGAGKTTTILMLLGLTEPTSGRALVGGFDPLRQPLEVKRIVGYMPDSVGFYDNLSGVANLRYTAHLAGIPTNESEKRIEAALERVRLKEAGRNRVGTYSHGMKQRLAVAEILMKGARVAILDEPTSGLDPQSTHEFLDLIRSLKGEGMTILLSSHLLDLVQSICDRVALFNHGKIGLSGRVLDLMRDVLGGSHVIQVEASGPGLAERLSAISGVTRVASPTPTSFVVEAARDVRDEIARTVIAGNGHLTALSLGHASLDDVYTHYFQDRRNAA
jgi:ABC-2 type transport system ATP-binding protein